LKNALKFKKATTSDVNSHFTEIFSHKTLSVMQKISMYFFWALLFWVLHS